jgi:hypothetical protein
VEALIMQREVVTTSNSSNGSPSCSHAYTHVLGYPYLPVHVSGVPSHRVHCRPRENSHNIHRAIRPIQSAHAFFQHSIRKHDHEQRHLPRQPAAPSFPPPCII